MTPSSNNLERKLFNVDTWYLVRIGFRVVLAADRDFLIKFSWRSPKSDPCVLNTVPGRFFLIRGRILLYLVWSVLYRVRALYSRLYITIVQRQQQQACDL